MTRFDEYDEQADRDEESEKNARRATRDLRGWTGVLTHDDLDALDFEQEFETFERFGCRG